MKRTVKVDGQCLKVLPFEHNKKVSVKSFKWGVSIKLSSFYRNF